MEAIMNLFTTEDLSLMKESMRQIVVDRFEKDLEEMQIWLFDDMQVESMITDMYAELLTEVKEKIKPILFDKLMSKMEA